jgi:hypothetical protein
VALVSSAALNIFFFFLAFSFLLFICSSDQNISFDLLYYFIQN